MIGYWRGLTEWERSATLAVRFLADNPRDPQLPQLRLEVARDRLAWAAKPIGKPLTRQELLAEVAARFAAARTELGKIVADFVKQRALQQEAQWDLANSFLTEARAVSAVSPTLARGQFVRAARELRAVAVKYPGHPRIGQIAQMLWGIAQEMESQGYEDEAVLVWNELAISDPMNPLAQQAIDKIAADLSPRPEAALEGGRDLPGVELHPRRQRCGHAGGRLPDRRVAEERETLGRGPARAGDLRRQLPAARPGRPGPGDDRPDPPDQPGLGGRHQGLPPRDRRIQGRPMGARGQVVDRRVQDQSQPVAGSDGRLPRLRGGLPARPQAGRGQPPPRHPQGPCPLPGA